ncbi:MAG: DUF3089 domain-containing protein [Alphaproteobacteria bacterium]
MKTVFAAATFAVASWSAHGEETTATAAAAQTAVSYGDDASWLCRPGRDDACAIDLDASVVSADGTVTTETFAPAEDPSVDCFYVYPTVSLDEQPNSDMTAGPEERAVVAVQFARFASVCRLFAPIYRQMTIPALRASLGGMDVGIDRDLAYNDVRAAFEDYMARDNGGRPFVLVGHSQGTSVLKRLVAEEIDGKPVQKQMLSALLIGNNVGVPEGKDVGGEFKSVPVCRTPDQTGCFVSYMTFRKDPARPANSFFGVMRRQAGQTAACVHPANLADNGAAPLDAYLGKNQAGTATAPDDAWVENGPMIGTRFVKVPGLLTGQCVSDGNGARWLEVTIKADPNDPRTDDISGDLLFDGQVADVWGLHLIDMHLAQGDLISLVKSQASAYAAAR